MLEGVNRFNNAQNIKGTSSGQGAEVQRNDPDSIFNKIKKMDKGELIGGNAGWKYETTDQTGNRVVVQYDDTGMNRTVKTYQGQSNRLYSSATYDKDNKLVKEGFYDFISGKLYMESEYNEKGRVDKFYNDDGSYTGKDVISKDKKGNSTRIENYDSNGNLTGYSIQTKEADGKFHVERFDADGKSLEKFDAPFDTSGQMVRA